MSKNKIPSKAEREFLRHQTEVKWRDAFWGMDEFYPEGDDREHSEQVHKIPILLVVHVSSTNVDEKNTKR